MYENKFMYDNNFALRISKLRTQKGVSARDMSLSIGQNAGYKQYRNRKSPALYDLFLLYLRVSGHYAAGVFRCRRRAAERVK